MKIAVAIGILTSLAMAKTDSNHELELRQLLNRPRGQSRKVEVCRISSLKIDEINKLLDQEICSARKTDNGRQGSPPKIENYTLKISKPLLQRALGKVFVTGNPCSPEIPNGPPASPATINAGIREVFKEVCEEQWLSENMHDMKEITVSSKVINTMNSLNLFFPLNCVPREVHP
ncbi:MAG: hypothetical protein EBR01_02685 [Proteobacteria bacterium]|nr:hypothetical protein [Pseudomonadota bacterium]